ncbi:hypothetical protein F5Y16DRAFT_380309 [Xylariaceae sp. FL0255]|nr:hypothetical protein F5Y16DRAFT_380309 [Xylariaceae sp. FL0255]
MSQPQPQPQPPSQAPTKGGTFRGNNTGVTGIGSSSRSSGSADDMPSRNPLPLSASQEAQVREVFNARVRELCAEEIGAFAACARDRTFTIPFKCRALSHAMNNCMLLHATPAEHDRAREQWFAGRHARAKEQREKEKRKLEQERFHREWWGLPERDPEQVRREMEKLERPERIGGVVVRRGEQGTKGQEQEQAGEKR